MKLSIAQVEEYLSRHFDQGIRVLTLSDLEDDEVVATAALGQEQNINGTRSSSGALKTFGYGRPVLVTYLRQGEEESVVFNTVAANHFGHEERADRVAEVVRSFEIYNTLPKHTRALDIGVLARGNHLQSLNGGREFFFLTEHVDGEVYANDLKRLRDTGEITGLDLRRAYQLAMYLAEIHSLRRNDEPLYTRRIRDTIGSGEGIMGLIDSYPAHYPLASAEWLEEMEHLCIAWRWKLRGRSSRLAQVHGNFHPFNILFERGIEFNVLDRSRGAWGEPADDVASMAINYLFFSLQRSGKLAAPFEQLWNIFWNTYLRETQDSELTSVIAPFIAWRALVLASPVWYNIDDGIRQRLLRVAETALRNERFEPSEINSIVEPSSISTSFPMADELNMKELNYESA